MRPPRGDEGAGSVLALAIVGVVALLGLLLGGFGAATVARTGAQSAADLAALAAGDSLALGLIAAGAGVDPSSERGFGAGSSLDAGAGWVASSGVAGGPSAAAERACLRAEEVARRNGASLESCTHEGQGVVVVHVSRSTPFGPALAGSRAGPSSTR